MIARSTLTSGERTHKLLPVKMVVRGVCVAAAVICICLFTTPAALAAKKKPKEAAPEEKSYVLPYMIVMAVVGVGLMTVCRPASRLDKSDEMNKKDKDED